MLPVAHAVGLAIPRVSAAQVQRIHSSLLARVYLNVRVTEALSSWLETRGRALAVTHPAPHATVLPAPLASAVRRPGHLSQTMVRAWQAARATSTPTPTKPATPVMQLVRHAATEPLQAAFRASLVRLSPLMLERARPHVQLGSI